MRLCLTKFNKVIMSNIPFNVPCIKTMIYWYELYINRPPEKKPTQALSSHHVITSQSVQFYTTINVRVYVYVK